VRKIIVPLCASILFSGCASLDPSPDFEAVRAIVAERVTGDVAWDRERAAALEIDQRVERLLAEELTTESAVQVALYRNRALQAALAEIGIARAELVQAGLLQNPVLSADVRFAVGAAGTGADLALVQEFLSILQIPLRKRVAEAERDATVFAVGAAIFELATAVREAFYDAQGAEQMVELGRTAAEATSLSADVARRQHEAGNLTDLDYANEQALDADAALALSDAEVEILVKRERLTALLGLSGDETRWSIARRLPALPPTERDASGLESLAVSKRLDLAEASQRIQASAQAVALVRFYGLLPEASAGVASEREPDEDGLWSVGPSIELPIPLFDQRQARLAAARARQRQREESFAALAVEVRSEVRLAWAHLDAARSRATYYEKVVLPLRRKILGETQREYNAMQVGVYQLLAAKRGEIEAGRGYIESLRDYWRGRVALERALGTGLPLEDGTPVPSSVPEEPPAPAPPPHHHGG
jgi:cobalt-zinc-cadmium efflux system outer membrane protein